VHAFMLRVAPYVVDVRTPKVLDLIDSMQLNIRRRVDREKIPLRWVFREELRRIRRYENSLSTHFDAMLVVSPGDKALIDGSNIHVIPLGVDTTAFSPAIDKKTSHQTLIFSGNMNYGPNVEAAIWFAERCFGKIRRSFPGARFVIVGGGPSAKVRGLARIEGVTVTGYVPSMPDILNTGHVAVAPMHSGSGMQFKILEAMACEIPVVTTQLGLGGIRADHNREVLIANSEEDFSAAVRSLLERPEWARELGRHGRSLVSSRYSWSAATARVQEIYEQIAHPKAPRGLSTSTGFR
jgi:glycosyltransferase involved in cell wall biosynthesis